MNWFYADAGKQAGPIDDAELARFVTSGKITGDTLVWREGMANWQTYWDVRREEMHAGESAPPVLPALAVPPAAALALGPNEILCAECRQVFDKGSAIPFEHFFICANCKPAFVQKLKEGARVTSGGLRTGVATPGIYAGFWIRVAAKVLDGIAMLIIVAILVGLLGLLGAFSFARMGDDDYVAGPLIMAAIHYSVVIAYPIFFVGKFSTTPGKMICGLKITTAQGGPLTWGRAVGRCFAAKLSELICYVGFLIVAFDVEKRALHDHICDTRVVFK